MNERVLTPEAEARRQRLLNFADDTAAIARQLQAQFPNVPEEVLLYQARELIQIQNQNEEAAQGRVGFLNRLFGAWKK